MAKFGDFTFPTYTDHRSTHLKVHLKTRAAVLLYRQCTALGIDGFDPKLAAGVIDFNRAAVDCAQTRAYMRRVGFSRQQIRKARLVDDVRFTAARGDGVADQFERRLDVPARVESAAAGAQVDCPPQTLDIVRITSPAAVEGSVQSASAARDGVSVHIGAPRSRLDNVEVGSEGGPWPVSRRQRRRVHDAAPGPRRRGGLERIRLARRLRVRAVTGARALHDRRPLRSVVLRRRRRRGQGAAGQRRLGDGRHDGADLQALPARRPRCQRLLSTDAARGRLVIASERSQGQAVGSERPHRGSLLGWRVWTGRSGDGRGVRLARRITAPTPAMATSIPARLAGAAPRRA